MKSKEFFVKLPSTLLARKDLTMTRRVVIGYFHTRAGCKTWEIDAIDLMDNVGLGRNTAYRELDELESDGTIECIGYSHHWQKRYKKYALTEVTKMGTSDDHRSAQDGTVEIPKMGTSAVPKMGTSNIYGTEDSGTEDRDTEEISTGKSSLKDNQPKELPSVVSSGDTSKSSPVVSNNKTDTISVVPSIKVSPVSVVKYQCPHIDPDKRKAYDEWLRKNPPTIIQFVRTKYSMNQEEKDKEARAKMSVRFPQSKIQLVD